MMWSYIFGFLPSELRPILLGLLGILAVFIVIKVVIVVLDMLPFV